MGLQRIALDAIAPDPGQPDHRDQALVDDGYGQFPIHADLLLKYLGADPA